MKELGIFNNDFSKCRSETLKEKPKIRRTSSCGVVRKNKETKLFSVEKRRSRRLASRHIVQFSDEVSRQILGDIDSCSVSWGDENGYCGNENSFIDDDFKYEKKPRRKYQMVGDREIPSVDEITEDDLKRIAVYVRDKVYSQDGTTCHQCRQKTEDQKTVCRSSKCIGVRGQFCGPCLKNRYGESVATSLKDPEWTCPPCRNMCNCSICRTHAGKIPTGQLTYFALQKGYDSVKHLLDDEDEN